MRIPVAASLLLLAAWQAPAQARASTPTISPLHGYVLGRAAFANDALTEAAQFFDAVHAQQPEAPELARRAFELAVAAGDKKRALALAGTLQANGQANAEVAVLLLTDAVLRKDWNAAAAARTGLSSAGYAAVVGPIVDAWIAHGRDDTDGALAILDPAQFTGFARSYVTEQRAHMLAAAGRWKEAAEAYSLLRAGTASGISFLRQGEADAVAQSGDKVRALALLDGDEPPTVAARERLKAGKRIGALAPDARRGLGWMAARLAADLSRERPVPLALLFARTATFLAPDIAASWLICGDVLARSNSREAALAAYAMVPEKDALAQTARIRRAEVLEAMGRGTEAGAMLAEAATAPDAGADAWVRLGDWHRRAERFDAAIEAYSRAIAATPDEGSGGGAGAWGLWFLRGSMKERAQDWPGAEADLRKALLLSEDEPVVLNYLGYSLLDRGLKLSEAATLIKKAATLRPDDGGIVDSLGWSQYRQGRYDEAATTLERASTLEPTDPTVTDHLGDAYWKIGRRIEARFRWRAALAMEPSEAQKKQLTAKLDYGLDAALAMAN
ncbi:tetratricopeptide repeat protein [Polymorphobacter sp.]|uniref:tetratricopeptide repeat protein n=1 Tax=Polymorphobacter sp. TaxID=1909290 RepID=UPI003F7036F4